MSGAKRDFLVNKRQTVIGVVHPQILGQMRRLEGFHITSEPTVVGVQEQCGVAVVARASIRAFASRAYSLRTQFSIDAGEAVMLLGAAFPHQGTVLLHA
jgi:hypothetical protein